MTDKTNIKSLAHGELRDLLSSWGVEGYRFDQLYRWIYQKDAGSFDEMTNLAKSIREKLKEHFFIGRFEPDAVQTSSDGTRKFLFQLSDRESIESVLIPNGDRQTLCISSQVGCAMGCTFCLTGTLGLTRNLNHYEIVEQVMAVGRAVRGDTEISNIVFMGMGEPLHNLENVLESLKYLLDERGLKFSKNKVTISTCGLVPQMRKLGEQSDVKLAVSLTATTDEIRNELIPVNRRYSLDDLLQACRDYPLTHRQRITFEYTLLKGVNDSMEDAKRLVKLLSGIPAKVNLIPFNEYPGAPYERTSDEVMLSFQKYLLDRHVQTNIRQSRGRDILGACGQLKAAMAPKSLPSRRVSADLR
jgi:23S rRNA (adenine2503-C2)-methyltransferase